MSELTSNNRVSAACREFEADLNAFVDGELDGLDADRVAKHVESCDGCHGFVDSLAQMARLHRTMDDELEAQERGGVDLPEELATKLEVGALWGDLTRRIVADLDQRLVPVLYQLGKALIAAGYETSPEYRNQVVYESRPGSISKLTQHGRQLLREREGLERTRARGELAERRVRERRSGASRQRGRLFPTRAAARGSAAFEAGRRCLEECLRLAPEHVGARIFHGVYLRKVGRLDLARKQFQAVLRNAERGAAGDGDALIASHQLARVYSEAHQFDRALEMERGNLERAQQLGHRMIQVAALANMMIYAVKLERFDDADRALERLVREFPDQLETVVAPAFQKARYFRMALLRNAEYLARLRSRYPALFAA